LVEHEPLLDRIGPALVFYGSLALVVTSSVGLVGVLLVFAFLVVPAVAALSLASRPGPALGWGMGIAALGSAGGLHAGFYLDLPAAPVVVLTLGVLLLAAALAGRRRGGRGDPDRETEGWPQRSRRGTKERENALVGDPDPAEARRVS
jgi:hypothetical protein